MGREARSARSSAVSAVQALRSDDSPHLQGGATGWLQRALLPDVPAIGEVIPATRDVAGSGADRIVGAMRLGVLQGDAAYAAMT